MTFANRYARQYSLDTLAAYFARCEGTTALSQMRRLAAMSRDDLIDMLRDLIKHEIAYGRTPANMVRGAYVAERLARIKDRIMLRQWCEEITSPEFEEPKPALHLASLSVQECAA